MYYALHGVNLEFESYNGNLTFKWNDSNLEVLNLTNKEKLNFKKVYPKIDYTGLYFWKNIRETNLSKVEEDVSSEHLYRFKAIHKMDFEDLEFDSENEKKFYNFFKNYFLDDSYYNVFIEDNYINFLNYKNFIKNLKVRMFANRYLKKKEKKGIDIKHCITSLDMDANISKIKQDILN